MKRIIFAGAIAAGASIAAMAMGAGETMDADGDGMVSYTELLAAFPTVTEETFTAADTDGDGLLTEAEMAAAQDAGALPVTEG